MTYRRTSSSSFVGSVPRSALVWMKLRDEMEDLLTDALEGLRRGDLTRREYDKAKARLTAARMKAEWNYEQTIRQHQERSRRR
jgi:hypothetical protein